MIDPITEYILFKEIADQERVIVDEIMIPIVLDPNRPVATAISVTTIVAAVAVGIAGIIADAKDAKYGACEKIEDFDKLKACRLTKDIKSHDDSIKVAKLGHNKCKTLKPNKQSKCKEKVEKIVNKINIKKQKAISKLKALKR